MTKRIKIFFEGESLAKNLIETNIDFEISSYENSEVVVSSKLLTGEYNRRKIQNCLSSYRKIKKIVLIFLVSDNSDVFSIPSNVILFRTSIYKSLKKKNEFILPYIWECYKEAENPIEKTQKPIIGFCGNINKNLGKRISTIEAFKNNTNIISNFILRNDFWGGKPNDEILKKEFYLNLKDSHFTICNRGRGNFAIRFYQTLSIGRIPILIDTDMYFPFEDKINWNSIIIIGKDEVDLVKNVLKWWETNSPDQVIEAQNICRKIFDDYFTFESFSSHILSIIQNKLETVKFEKSRKNFFQRLLSK